MNFRIPIFILCILLSICAVAQNEITNRINMNKMIGFALNTDIQSILKVLDTVKVATPQDEKIKQKFEDRFKFETDKSDYFKKSDTTLNALNRIFQVYWRKALLDNKTNFDRYLEDKLLDFFQTENAKQKYTDLKIDKDSIEPIYNQYIHKKGFHTTGYGKTGSLFDLLVWKTEIDTTYTIKLINDTVHVNVHFMDGFISLGWEEYATFGIAYPGGWATKTSLFCVKKSYDLKSEDFYISYLGHEGQHFSDYKHFPKLASRDLEYRAKLSELSFADQNIYKLIGTFINNAKYDKTNPHPFANYCVIRDLSKLIFKHDFETNIDKWKQVPKAEINSSAKQLFIRNTKALRAKGKDVVSILK